MATTLNFKSIIDLPMWRPESPALATSGAGMTVACDLRNDASRHPFAYLHRSGAILDAFDPIRGDWISTINNPGSGAIAAGAHSTFHSAHGPRGTITAVSTTQVTLSALTHTPTSTALNGVGINQLANKGDGVGYKIRIYGIVTGKTEEKTIIANTAGTTPTIIVDSAFSFTPSTNDKYELLSGVIYILGVAATTRFYDVATNTSGGIANSPTATTAACSVALSEQYVSNDRVPGSGFVNGTSSYNNATVNCIIATATSNTTNATVTGSGMPADLQANEYRNFQLRIVEDTGTPTAIGQRMRITSHTGGATGVFTLTGTFPVIQPSATAKFVIENPDAWMITRTAAGTATNVYNAYSYGGTAVNTWTTLATVGTTNAAGCGMVQSFGITRDTSTTLTARHSYIYNFVGGAQIDVFDLAGGANGTNSTLNLYGNKSAVTFPSGTGYTYDPVTLGGRYVHICGTIASTSQRMVRFDLRNNVIETGTYLRFPQGASVEGSKMWNHLFVDGTTKACFIYQLTQTQSQVFSLMITK